MFSPPLKTNFLSQNTHNIMRYLGIKMGENVRLVCKRAPPFSMLYFVVVAKKKYFTSFFAK